MRYAAIYAMALVGCAQSSGALKMGPNTYTITVAAAPARGGETAARRLAIEEATATCQGLGRELLVKDMTSGPATHGAGGAVDLIFRCLEADDPEMKRPTYKRVPDTVIEDLRSPAR
jgi:hypothetical protein